MEKLDVVVIDADQFSKEALIQIAGRREKEASAKRACDLLS